MTSPAPAKPITADAFLQMPESEGAELVDGVIVEKSVGNESSWLAGEILALISAFIRDKGMGRVFDSENGIRIWPNRPNHVRKPDVTFIRSSRLPGNRPVKGWLEVVPDLVVEVVSPNDRADDLEQKLVDYREAGIPLVWVVYPGSRRAQVLTPVARLDVHPSGVLEGGDALPGFQLSLEELFAALEGD